MKSVQISVLVCGNGRSVSTIIARVCQIREMVVRRALWQQHGSVCTSVCRMELLRVWKPSSARVRSSGDSEVFLA